MKQAGIVLAIAATGLSGCVGAGADIGTRPAYRSVYNCGPDGRLSVRRTSGAVEVTSPRGVEVRLPASPPGQSARYGTPPYALVIEGGEALWFVTGKRPLTCRR